MHPKGFRVFRKMGFMPTLFSERGLTTDKIYDGYFQ